MATLFTTGRCSPIVSGSETVSSATLAWIVLGAGCLLVVLGLIVWQEGKRRREPREPLTYVIEDAVRFIEDRIDPATELKRFDIRRILEYEIFYLQGLAQERRSNPVETVAGGHDASIEFIVSEIEARHRVIYPREDVAKVLALEAEYLVEIGAVGEAVMPPGGDEE